MRNKLGPKAFKSAFIGYAENSKAYRLLDLESNIVVESRDVEFFENKCSTDSEITENNAQMQDTNNSESKETHVDSHEKTNDSKDMTEPRISTRARKTKDLGPDFIVLFFLLKETEIITW